MKQQILGVMQETGRAVLILIEIEKKENSYTGCIACRRDNFSGMLIILLTYLFVT